MQNTSSIPEGISGIIAGYGEILTATALRSTSLVLRMTPPFACGGLQQPQKRPLKRRPAIHNANSEIIICITEGKSTNPKRPAVALCFTVSKQHCCFRSNVTQPAQKATVLLPLYLLILHHVHYNPVEGIDVLPNQILEHDECFHQKILKENKIFGKDHSSS